MCIRDSIWDYLRSNFLSHCVWDTYEAILDACCDAWNALMANPRLSSQLERENGHRSKLRAVGIRSSEKAGTVESPVVRTAKEKITKRFIASSSFMPRSDRRMAHAVLVYVLKGPGQADSSARANVPKIIVAATNKRVAPKCFMPA